MRRLATLLGGAVLAASVVVLSGGSPASASCPGGNGTLPGTAAKAVPVSAGGKTFYVDDRDLVDDDDKDGLSGGLWLYEETNTFAGLQRGGAQWVEGSVPLPYIAEQTVSTPGVGPVPSQNRKLFAGGFGGGTLAQETGGFDDCYDSPYAPDRIWF